MYKEIGPSREPSVTGITNGDDQVQLSEEKSFVSDDERRYYKEYFRKIGSFLTTDFKNIEKSKLTKLTYFPSRKAKKTDFISFSPSKFALDFIVSQKVIDIFEQFTIADYIKIPAKIQGFKTDYYTIGFPMIPRDKIDFDNSEFGYILSREIVVINTREDYIEKIIKLYSRKIKMTDKLPFDVISMEGQGIFFSDKLIEKLEQKNITGFQIHNTILE